MQLVIDVSLVTNRLVNQLDGHLTTLQNNLSQGINESVILRYNFDFQLLLVTFNDACKA